jgi:hypothetical protein
MALKVAFNALWSVERKMVPTRFIFKFPAPFALPFRVAIPLNYGYSTHKPAYPACRSVHPGSKLVAAVRIVMFTLKTGRLFGLINDRLLANKPASRTHGSSGLPSRNSMSCHSYVHAKVHLRAQNGVNGAQARRGEKLNEPSRLYMYMPEH